MLQAFPAVFGALVGGVFAFEEIVDGVGAHGDHAASCCGDVVVVFNHGPADGVDA